MDLAPWSVMLIYKFFDMRKLDNMSMDLYLTEVKEVVDLLEELDVDLSKAIVVYYIVRHLLS